eukprot:CAMPEP_0182509414 /NCGR_PEP_ID=MMETSP1321-20130603/26824_1 /TAXON_ID=91990 /ORGANISM="Bolidomonas sp., Strain RCC1657" /LENGTH=160 /DNA_ID=CAMNT_0024715685 /DNA_START=84 /DNA_END=563 /DNA_ORIENTATION=+
MYGSEDSSVNHSEEEETDAWDTDSSAGLATGGGKKKSYSIDDHNPDDREEVDEENGNAFATSQTMYGAIGSGSGSGSVGVGSGEGVSLLRDQGGGVKVVSAGDGEEDGKGSTLSLLHEQGGGVKIIQDISGDGRGDGMGSKGRSSLQRRRSSKKKKAAMN